MIARNEILLVKPVLGDGMGRIAILQDANHENEPLSEWLEHAEHKCQLFKQSKEFLRHAARESFDLCVIDWGLNDVQGLKVLSWLREHVSAPLPVIFTASQNNEASVVSALNAGADDYLSRPLRQFETVARVNALLRKSHIPLLPTAGESISVDHIRLDPLARAAYVRGEIVSLTQKEFDLAQLFLREPGRLFSRGHILDAIWGPTAGHVTARTVDTHVSIIRHKLELKTTSGLRITSVYHFGYKLQLAEPNRPDPAAKRLRFRSQAGLAFSAI